METAYFLAGDEAVALIAPAVEARLAYRERIREVSKRIGAIGTMAHDGDQVAYWILPHGAPVPEGWKRAPRVRNVNGAVPDHRHVAGRAVWSELGVRVAMPCDRLGKRETLRLPNGILVSSYGYERIGDTWIVQARLHEGRVVGGDPKWCRRIRNSEYWLLREAAGYWFVFRENEGFHTERALRSCSIASRGARRKERSCKIQNRPCGLRQTPTSLGGGTW